MRIEKLEIKGFGKIENLTLNFSKGFNIVFGKNESGKTSIQWFIKAMFYGLRGGKSSKEGILPPLKKYKPWSLNEFNGFMEYRLADGDLYRIGRNFNTNSTRIFDSLFNDITSNFEISKEKGVAFADRHLGLNEACFDKTVFIRQMESKIDDDGSKELLNRLINISQTGFEDVSFKKAQEALRNALISYVGTDKTTTRPLDKVILRLEELKGNRTELVKKRDSQFALEEELKEAVIEKSELENKKFILTRLKDAICIKINLQSSKKMKNVLEELLENMVKDEDELRKVVTRMEDFNSIGNEYSKFSAFDNEDIDKLEKDYQKLLGIMEETEKFKLDVVRKQEILKKIKEWLASRQELGSIRDGTESSIAELNKDLEYLKKEYNKTNMELLNEKIKNSLGKEKFYKIITILIASLSLLFGMVSFYSLIIGLPGALVAVAFAVALLVLKISESKKLSELKNEKKMLFVNASNLSEEINKKEKSLQAIYSMVGVDNFEAFVRLKVEFDNNMQQAESLQKDIDRMETVDQSNIERISQLRKVIADKLLEADIILGDTFEINDKSIRDFKFGVRRYKGIEPSIGYSNQRKEDLTSAMEKYYKNASAISGSECNEKEDLIERLKEINIEIDSLEENLAVSNEVIKEQYSKEDFLSAYFKNLSEDYVETHLNEINNILESESEKIEEGLKSIQLHIKEWETLLKSVNNDDEDMQRIDEEMETLIIKKNQLEDINISLKTALDIMTEASLEIQKDFVPALNAKMSGIIEKITGGRYTELRADDKLALKTIAPETGDIVSAALLSGGTIDQMYLTLRIAMADILTEEKEVLPLIMDEVFAQYDDSRTEESFKLLQQMEPDRQMIFFTCKGREVEIARGIFGKDLQVISL